MWLCSASLKIDPNLPKPHENYRSELLIFSKIDILVSHFRTISQKSQNFTRKVWKFQKCPIFPGHCFLAISLASGCFIDFWFFLQFFRFETREDSIFPLYFRRFPRILSTALFRFDVFRLKNPNVGTSVGGFLGCGCPDSRRGRVESHRRR